MRSTRVSLFAGMVLLGTTIVIPFLLTGVASAGCSESVSRYGRCTYQGDLLVCGSCALPDSANSISACNRCGTGYLCSSHSCTLRSGCADEYTCDLCGCSWGQATGAAGTKDRSMEVWK